MLFLSDEVNPGERRRRKSAAPAPSDAMTGSSRRKASVEGASLLVPHAARRRSMQPVSVSPRNEQLEMSHSQTSNGLAAPAGSFTIDPGSRGNSTRRMSLVRRASIASGSPNTASPGTGVLRPGSGRPPLAGSHRKRRSVTFTGGESTEDHQPPALLVSSDKAGDSVEDDGGAPRDVVIPINVGSDFQAFADETPGGIAAVSSEDGGTLSPQALPSPRQPFDPDDAPKVLLFADHVAETTSSHGGDDGGGHGGDDEDRIEYTAEEIPSSLFIFSGENPLRIFCLTVVQNWFFHQFILACIVANSITLAMDQPAVDNPEGLKTFLTISEYVFTVIFLVECVLKVIALGFVAHNHAYLRTPWNVLDFIIVIASIVSLFTTSSNVSALRVVRVLRPLRSVSRIKNLRMLIAGLFQALPEVVNNLLLFGFLTLVFAVAAVQLWSSKLSQRCYVTEFEDGFASDARYTNLTTPFLVRDDTEPCGGTHSCAATYGNGSDIHCEIHRDLYKRRNLNYDNFFAASLLVFKVMVFDNWPDDLEDAQNAIGPSSIFFFVLLTLIGGYVCVNLFLAVLTQGYSKAAHQIQNEEELELVDTGAQTDFDSPTELSKEEAAEVDRQALAAEVKRKKAGKKKAKRAATFRFGSPSAGSGSGAGGRSTAGGGSQGSMSPQTSPHGSTRLARKSATESTSNSLRFASPAPQHSPPAAAAPVNNGGTHKRSSQASPAAGGLDGIGTAVEMTEGELQHIQEPDADAGHDKKRVRLRGEPQTVEVGDADDSANNYGEGDLPGLLSPSESQAGLNDPDLLLGQSARGIPDWDDDDFDFDDDEFEYNPADPRAWIRQLVGYIVVHRATEIIMMLVTLLNVVVLAIDHYGIDDDLAYNLDVISLVCTIVFTVEITVKIFAFGPKCLKNGFNALDFLLVVIALVTIAIYGWRAGGSISAFRALRVFRVFRLLSKFESLQTVIDGILQSVASIGYLSFLILLFLYVWSIMGMQVFGTTYGENDPEVRDSFGTIWQSAILTFIVVTGDNWTDKMQVAMTSYSGGLEIIPVVYFVSLYMIGNFILINLSVAIIVDKLQEKMEALDAKQNAEEHPPILLIAPFAVGQMAYRDAIEEELRNFNGTQTMSGGGLLSSTFTAKSFRMKSFRQTGSHADLHQEANNSSAMMPQPTLTEVLAPRTDIERSRVEAALERRSTMSHESASPTLDGSVKISTSGREEEPDESEPATRQATIVTPKSTAPASPSSPPKANTLAAPPAPARVGSAAGARPTAAPQPVFTETIDANLAMKLALKEQDEADAAEAAALGHAQDSSENIPLTEARYADALAADRSSAGHRCHLFTLYLKSFTVSTPPIVEADSKSLFVFTVDNPVRRACLYLVGLPLYSGFILFCIIANVVFLMLDGPGASDGTLFAILVSDYIFAIIFFVEMVIKIIALGAWIEAPKGDDTVPTATTGGESHGNDTASGELDGGVGDHVALDTAPRGHELSVDSATAGGNHGANSRSNDQGPPPTLSTSELELGQAADSQSIVETPAASDLDALQKRINERFSSRDDVNADGHGDDDLPLGGADTQAPSPQDASVAVEGQQRKTGGSGTRLRGHRAGRLVRPYFRDAWNIIDCFVTLISIVGLFVPLLKALRALRTIRLVARIETTRIILVALVQAVPHVMHGLLLSLVVYLVFGILGVQLFKGRLYRCSDPSVELRSMCNGTWINQVPGAVFDVPTPTPRVWERTTYHFDHLGAALMTLFVVSIGDGWSDIMFDGMDIVDDEHALRRNNAPWMSLYFIMVFIACNFFAINMMIGILINYFSKKKQEQDGSAFLTPKQQQYVKARDIIASNTVGEESIRTLDNSVSTRVAEIITYRHPAVQRISVFDGVMLAFIIVNVIAVAAEHDDMNPSVEQSLSIIQLVCLCVFTLEMLIKWVAYGPWYFTTNWNRFDFVIVAVGWISFGLPQVKFLAFLRVFRVVKLIRDTGVEKLIFMLVRSIASLLHVVTILLLTYFIFAVAGVALFGNVKFNGSINKNNNFRTVWGAMLTLYQCATTENWNGVMEGVSVQPPACDPALDECGNPEVATTYFILFMICCTFIALQLFVAIIVEIFDGDADSSDPIRNAFAEMRAIWIEQFGEETPRVHYTELIEILPFFPPVLTDFPEGETITRADMLRFLASLPIPIDSGHRVRYTDVVNALAFKKYQVDPRTMGSLIEDMMANLFVGAAFSVAQVYALDVIADLWLQYKGDTLKHCISQSQVRRRNSMRRSSLGGSGKSDPANNSGSFDPVSNPAQRDPGVVDAKRRSSIGAARPSTAAVTITADADDVDQVISGAASSNGAAADDTKPGAAGSANTRPDTSSADPDGSASTHAFPSDESKRTLRSVTSGDLAGGNDQQCHPESEEAGQPQQQLAKSLTVPRSDSVDMESVNGGDD